MEGRCVVGNHVLRAVLGAGGQFIIGHLALAEHALDASLRPCRIGEKILEWRADEAFTRTARQRLHLLVHIGDDAGRIGGHDRVDVGFDQRARIELLVAQRLLCCVFAGDIAKHQDSPHHQTVAITDRRAAVGDVAFAAVAGDQDRMVGQALNGAVRQGRRDRDDGRQPGFLVDDVEDLSHQPAGSLCLRPAGELLRQRIHQHHPCFRIGGNDRIANGIERDSELFFADLQGGVGLFQLPVCLLLYLQQMQPLFLDLFAHRVVGANQEIADDAAMIMNVAQRSD